MSGQAFLKIPMPEPEAIQTLLSSLGALLGGLIEGQKKYKELDLGPGGYTTTPSSETKKAVKAAIQRKLGR